MSEQVDDRTLQGDPDSTLPGDRDGAATTRATELRRGTMVGRYVLASRLGAGGMGVVFAAYDPELDRRIAIKFLHPELGGVGASERLLREAQTMARLSHPNVVIVHDVGTFEGNVYIAMEYVQGKTLAQWWTGATRTWREVVAIMREAGEGLAAAHDKGVVHRDFKPENVMVGDDSQGALAFGTVRVMDFGIARVGAMLPAELEQTTTGSMSLTRSGMVGTPRYMAAEQFAGALADARSDQFAFCVALYEGLYGSAPFQGDALAVLADAVTSGAIAISREQREVPSWLADVVHRGLSPDPGARWPSMRALLDALADDPSIRRRRRWIALGVVGAASLVGAGLVVRERRAVAACEDAGAEITATWNDTTRLAVGAGLHTGKLTYATALVDRVVPLLDAHADAWAEARTAACLAQRREPLPPQFAASSSACFDETRASLERLVAELSDAPSRAAIRQSILAARTLGDVGECTDLVALGRRPALPDDAALREQVQAIEASLARASTLRDLGEVDTALAVAREAFAAAAALEWPPLRAHAGIVLGTVLVDGGSGAEAVGLFEDAALRAGVAGNPSAVVAAELWRMHTLRDPLRRLDDAAKVGRLVEEVLVSAGLERSFLHGKWHLEQSALLEAQNDLDGAESHIDRAQEIWQEQLGPDHPEVAALTSHRATIAYARGEYETSATLHRENVAGCTAAFGPEHPRTGIALASLTGAEMAAGHYDQALIDGNRSVAVLEAAFEHSNRALASAHLNLGGVLHAKGELGPAADHFRGAIATLEAAFGSDHPDIALPLGNLAMIEKERGELEAAATHFRRALVLEEKSVGPTHPSLAFSLTGLGDVLRREGRYDDALQHLERAIHLMEQANGPTHADIGHPLISVGMVQRAQGDRLEAVSTYRRAIAIWEQSLGASHPLLATPLNNLGVVLRDLADHEPRARATHLADATAAFERALAIAEATDGRDAAAAIGPLRGLAEIARRTGRVADAVTMLERAVAIAEAKLEPSDPDIAETKAALDRVRTAPPPGRGTGKRAG